MPAGRGRRGSRGAACGGWSARCWSARCCVPVAGGPARRQRRPQRGRRHGGGRGRHGGQGLRPVAGSGRARRRRRVDRQGGEGLAVGVRGAQPRRRPGDVGRRGRPVGGVLGEQLLHERAHRARHVRGQRRRRRLQVTEDDRDRVVGLERPAPGQALVRHDAEGVEVAARAGRSATGLLGRQVQRRADQLAGAGEGGRAGRRGDPEVGDLHDAVRPYEQVARLDVAVHDAAVVGGLQGGGGLRQHVEGAVDAEDAVPAQQRRQRLAVDELHDEPRPVGQLAVVVDRRDPGVRQPCCVPGLGAEAGAELLVVDELGAQRLDRDRSVEHARPARATPRPCRRRRCAPRAGSGRRAARRRGR